MIKGRREVVRIGVFHGYVPHYRLGIFRALQSRDDMEFTICASEGKRYGFSDTQIKEKNFPFVKIRLWQLKIPILKKFITLQFYPMLSLVRKKFDVIILPNDFSDISVWISLILGRMLGRKVCLWGHGTTKRYARLGRLFRGTIMRLANAVIFYSEKAAEEWIKRGYPAEKLFVAYNALDTDKSRAIKARLTDEDIRAFKKEKGLESKKIVLFTGRLFKRKKIDVLIRAMKEVTARVSNVGAIIIGDGPMRRQLQQLSEQLGLSDSVTFTGSIYDEETVANYLLCSRVMVIPGAAGLSVQHAFGYAVPVITDDDIKNQGPEVELVEHGRTGIICRSGDVSDFAENICRVLTDDALHQTMSRNASDRIETAFNLTKMAAGFFDAVNYCMGK